jgi:uncharacterized membrane protein YhaH (DUF805 family)
MNFGQAVRSALNQYVGFKGRARRSEYWWFTLFTLLVEVVALIFDAVAGTSFIAIIVELALLLPSLAVSVRRLHDTDRSGWWLLIGLIPLVGLIVLLVFFCQDSNQGVNHYGDSPKYPFDGYGQLPRPAAPYPTQQPPWGQPPDPGR